VATTPIFDEVSRERGLSPVERPLGSVAPVTFERNVDRCRMCPDPVREDDAYCSDGCADLEASLVCEARHAQGLADGADVVPEWPSLRWPFPTTTYEDL
jgi:hypothetical protein